MTTRIASRPDGPETRGILYVHSAPSALCPHIEWAVGGVLGVAVSLDWTPQPAQPGSYRAELSWTGVAGTAAAVASGMVGVAHFGSAQQNEFTGYLLDAIAAVVVGGTSLFGGRGGIGNTIVGLCVLGVLNNGLDHVEIDSFLKILIRGVILLIALIINVYAQRLRDESATAG